jgi:hypothetical protein
VGRIPDGGPGKAQGYRRIQIAMVSSMQLFPLRYSPLISSRIAPSGSLKQTTLILASDESCHFVGQCLSPNGGDVML